MRKWITLLVTLAAGCGSYANAALMGEVDFDIGYRRDTIDWRYRFPSDKPFAKNNVQAKDLDIFQIQLNGRTTIGCNFYCRGNAYWGWILDGDFRSSTDAYFSAGDYFSGSSGNNDNFRVGFSEEHRSTVSDQYVFGVGAAVGYPFYFCDCTMLLAPVIGYSFDEQNVRGDDRDVEFGGDYSYFEGVSGQCCDKTFISRWYGPFVGLDFEWRPWNTCFTVWAELEYHWGSFRGKRSNPDDYGVLDHGNRHSNDASAWVFAFGADYDLNNCWTLGVSLKFQDWAADRHAHVCTDALYYVSHCDDRARQNNKWRSYAVNLTLGREF